MGITTGILLFDGAEELDFAGPWEVFTMARTRRRPVVTIAERPDPVHCAKGLRVLPGPHASPTRPPLDVLVVPGGQGTPPRGRQPGAHRLDRPGRAGLHLGHERLHRRLPPARRRVRPGASRSRPTGPRSSACGRSRTSPVRERVRHVVDGNLVTAAGVSAGIDMALWVVGQIYGVEHARATQHAMEYYPDAALRRAASELRPYRVSSRRRRAPMVRIVESASRALWISSQWRSVSESGTKPGSRDCARRARRRSRWSSGAGCSSGSSRSSSSSSSGSPPSWRRGRPAGSRSSPASPWILRAAVAALGLGFCFYAVEKEIHLHRLSRLLVDERVLNSAMAQPPADERRAVQRGQGAELGPRPRRRARRDPRQRARPPRRRDRFGDARRGRGVAARRRGPRQPARPRRAGQARRVHRRTRRAQPRAAADLRRRRAGRLPGLRGPRAHHVERDVRAARRTAASCSAC